MVKIGKKEKNGELYKAILLLKDEQECYEFFQDLCTVSELRAMEQRFEVASLLDDGMIYNEILERTGASSATISRVNRSLSYGTGAYEKIFAPVQEARTNEQLRRPGRQLRCADSGCGIPPAGRLPGRGCSAEAPSRCETVLDLACGTGTMACLLAERGYRVIGRGRHRRRC